MKKLFLLAMLCFLQLQVFAQSEGKPDKVYNLPLSFSAEDLQKIFDTGLKDDVFELATQEKTVVVNYYKGIVPFWFNKDPTQEKKICASLSNIGFAKCVKDSVDRGCKVTVWKNESGGYEADEHSCKK